MRPLMVGFSLLFLLHSLPVFAQAERERIEDIATLEMPMVKIEKLSGDLQYAEKYVERNAHLLANIINAVIQGSRQNTLTLPAPAGFQHLQALTLNEYGRITVIGGIYASRFRHHIIIAFRHTLTAYEWKLENMTPLTPYHNDQALMTNSGAYSAHIQLQDQIKTILKKYPRINNIWFTGHSLGATIATLCAYDATSYLSKDKKISLYTFGSPRSVNPALANAIDNSTLQVFRVVNIEDSIVAQPPAAIKKATYQHVQTPIFYQFNGPSAAANHAFYLREFLSQPDAYTRLGVEKAAKTKKQDAIHK